MIQITWKGSSPWAQFCKILYEESFTRHKHDRAWCDFISGNIGIICGWDQISSCLYTANCVMHWMNLDSLIIHFTNMVSWGPTAKHGKHLWKQRISKA